MTWNHSSSYRYLQNVTQICTATKVALFQFLGHFIKSESIAKTNMHFSFSKFALYVCYDLLLNPITLLQQLYTPLSRVQLL